MYSKSLFGFGTNFNSQKSFINPIHNNIPFINNELLFTSEQNKAINKIHKYYTRPLGNQNFSDIAENYIEYSELYSTISTLELNTNNKTIKILLKITLEGLTGAIHMVGLNRDMIDTNIQNLILNNKLKSVLQNNQNQYAIDSTTKKYTLHKTFTLAPIYSYYIAIFGLPEDNSEFNPTKIKLLLSMLTKYNINPYF
jgi:hypothetical protein